MRPVFRPEPALPASAMKTYGIVAPKSTHYRPATCVEVDCPNHLNGWQTVVDESTDLGQAQGHYIRNEAGRRYTEAREAALTTFTFEAGQQCFREHEARLDRPEIYVVRDGDWRGNPRGTGPRIHKDPQGWIDDFGEHQERLADRLGRG